MALRRDVDLEDVAEALLHEDDALVVRRPGGALAEMRQPDDVRREALFGTAFLVPWGAGVDTRSAIAEIMNQRMAGECGMSWECVKNGEEGLP